MVQKRYELSELRIDLIPSDFFIVFFILQDHRSVINI